MLKNNHSLNLFSSRLHVVLNNNKFLNSDCMLQITIFTDNAVTNECIVLSLSGLQATNKKLKSNIYKLSHTFSFRDFFFFRIQQFFFVTSFFILYRNITQTIFVVYVACLFLLLWHMHSSFPFAVHQSLPVPPFFFSVTPLSWYP